jgi:cation diffusion facilitator CzcD-associated flavoprotein CzcO
MKFGHKVEEARWNEKDAKWDITVADNATGKSISGSVDILVTAIGVLNEWRWPEIPGLHSFKGTLLHSAAWDMNFQPEVRSCIFQSECLL